MGDIRFKKLIDAKLHGLSSIARAYSKDTSHKLLKLKKIPGSVNQCLVIQTSKQKFLTGEEEVSKCF